jgi:hypothetical protein
MADEDDWFEDYADGDDEAQVDEYDITASPNDFNVLTLYSFIESGAVKIPGFQRNFVWDRIRASKLIESLIIGIPVPQLFLYEQARNKFLVIDGQQRLMTVYYFIKRRFPLREKRVELRTIFDKNGSIPESILADDEYFENFKLQLSSNLPNSKNRFNGLNYATLGDYKTQLDLRPIRNIVVKGNYPVDKAWRMGHHLPVNRKPPPCQAISTTQSFMMRPRLASGSRHGFGPTARSAHIAAKLKSSPVCTVRRIAPA